MQDIKDYLIKLTPVAMIILGYYGYINLTVLESDDAKITAEITPVTSRMAGTIDKVLVAEHQDVRSGDTIAQYDDRAFLNAISTAETEASSAQSKLFEAEVNQNKAALRLKNHEITREKFNEIQEAYNKASLNLKSAKEKVDEAKQKLGQTKINSPQDGTIHKKYIEDGMIVSEGQKLFDFSGGANRWATGNFSVSQLDRIKPGVEASVRVLGFGGKTYRGEVESVAKRTTASFAQYPPEASGPDITKNSARTVVKVRLLNLSKEDKMALQDGLPANISINVK